MICHLCRRRVYDHYPYGTKWWICGVCWEEENACNLEGGGFMWLKFIVKSFIPPILDVIIHVLGTLAAKTESDVDDNLVAIIEREKESIAEEVYKLL